MAVSSNEEGRVSACKKTRWGLRVFDGSGWHCSVCPGTEWVHPATACIWELLMRLCKSAGFVLSGSFRGKSELSTGSQEHPSLFHSPCQSRSPNLVTDDLLHQSKICGNHAPIQSNNLGASLWVSRNGMWSAMDYFSLVSAVPFLFLLPFFGPPPTTPPTFILYF